MNHKDGAIHPAVAPDRRYGTLYVHRRTIAPEENVLMLAQRLPSREHLTQRTFPDRKRLPIRTLVMKLVMKDFADQLVGIPIEHTLGGGIYERNPPPSVHQEQPFRRIVGDRLHQAEL